MARRATRRVIGTFALLLLAATAGAQEVVTLEQAGTRSGADFEPAFEGHSVLIEGQVAAAPLWALGMYYLPVQDATEHGLILRGELIQFAGLAPGDWIEVTGILETRSGLVLLGPQKIQKTGHTDPPAPKDLRAADLAGFRYQGLMVRTSATVDHVGENTGGKILQVSDGITVLSVFLPRPRDASSDIARVRVGDRIHVSGLATQYSPARPYNTGFQILLPAADDLKIVEGAPTLSRTALGAGLAAIMVVAVVWWIRERRMRSQRETMRSFHGLSEDIIAAATPAAIAEKLTTVLPDVSDATSASLYLYQRRTNSLERVPTSEDPEPMAASIDEPPDGLANAAVVCFRNRTLLNIPDVRRNPLVKVGPAMRLPRSAMFVPLFSQQETLGVLEVGNHRRPGFFSPEEQAAMQHLANQAAASLKLQEQRAMREQLFHSERLAATGLLISGVANELRAPLENILQLADALSSRQSAPPPDRELRMLKGESRRAAEIVSRLVSFAGQQDSVPSRIDINAAIAGLVQFREHEWHALGLRVQNRLSPEPAPVLGAQGQIEQVFLNLLVHAEQRSGQAPGKTIAVQSSVIAQRVLVEISYSAPLEDADLEPDPFADRAASAAGLGLGVCQGIVHSHGGEIRFRTRLGTARFEVELPLSRASQEQASALPEVRRNGRVLTLMVVDPDAAPQRQLLGLLSAKGHRVVPSAPREAADLAQRLRFDGVFWAVRAGSAGWSDSHEQIRMHAPSFVLVSDGYDRDLALSLEQDGGFLLARPIQDAELDRIMAAMSDRAPVPQA